MPEQPKAKPAPTYVIFDVDVYDPLQYQGFMRSVRSAVENAGGEYLVRGGVHAVHEGDWQPRRIVLLKFPSKAAWEAFYYGPLYQGLKAVRDRSSSARLVSVQGLESETSG
jgi:uncharacterized protein (DUF1330 family)